MAGVFEKTLGQVLAEDTILIAGTENPQVVRAKHKKVVNIFSEDEARLWLSKKTKEKQLKKYYSKDRG